MLLLNIVTPFTIFLGHTSENASFVFNIYFSYEVLKSCPVQRQIRFKYFTKQ